MVALLDTLTKGAAYLEKKGVDSPRLTMELLAAHVLQRKRMQLYLEFDRPLSEVELASLRELLRKRGERIPLQHLLGTVEFYGQTFLCDERALIPRPETEELVEILMKREFPESLKILDLCSGSGVIGISLKAALGDGAEVTLADLSLEALSLARENAQKVGVEVKLVHSDLFDEIEEKYDLIVCNPPYVSDKVTLEPELVHDPEMALFSGEDGLDHLRRIIPAARGHLEKNGVLALEIGFDQAAGVREIFLGSGYQELEILEDMEKIPRFPVARYG